MKCVTTPTLVAKVYQKPLAREAEEKIRLMVAMTAIKNSPVNCSVAYFLSPFAARRFGRRVPNAKACWLLSDSQDL